MNPTLPGALAGIILTVLFAGCAQHKATATRLSPGPGGFAHDPIADAPELNLHAFPMRIIRDTVGSSDDALAEIECMYKGGFDRQLIASGSAVRFDAGADVSSSAQPTQTYIAEVVAENGIVAYVCAADLQPRDEAR